MNNKLTQFFKRNKLMLLIIGVVVALIVCFWLISLGVKAQVNKLENYVESSSADITVVEKERTDKLNTLFSTVKAVAKHETDVIDSITSARQKIDTSLAEGNLGAVQSEMEKVSTDIKILVEAYPEISATDAYIEFMNASSISESKIASHRTNYNAAVREYNDFVDNPINILWLNLTGYKVKALEYLDFGTTYQDPVEYNWEE